MHCCRNYDTCQLRGQITQFHALMPHATLSPLYQRQRSASRNAFPAVPTSTLCHTTVAPAVPTSTLCLTQLSLPLYQRQRSASRNCRPAVPTSTLCCVTINTTGLSVQVENKWSLCQLWGFGIVVWQINFISAMFIIIPCLSFIRTHKIYNSVKLPNFYWKNIFKLNRFRFNNYHLWMSGIKKITKRIIKHTQKIFWKLALMYWSFNELHD